MSSQCRGVDERNRRIPAKNKHSPGGLNPEKHSND